MQKGQIFIWTIVGTLVILIAGGAYYLGRSTSPKSSTTPTVISQTPQPITTSSDETANWETYTNNKYYYSIKYPTDWTLFGSGPGQTPEFIAQHFWITLTGPKNCEETAKHCGHITIRVEELNERGLKLSAKEIWLRDLTKNMRPVIEKEENVEINGVMITKISYIDNFINGQTSKSTAPIPMKTLVLIKNNKIYEIDVREMTHLSSMVGDYKNTAFPEWIYDSLYSQIISTFKFL